jgi:hypothetical protein
LVNTQHFCKFIVYWVNWISRTSWIYWMLMSKFFTVIWKRVLGIKDWSLSCKIGLLILALLIDWSWSFKVFDRKVFVKEISKPCLNSNVVSPRSLDIVFKRIGFAIQKGLAVQLIAVLCLKNKVWNQKPVSRLKEAREGSTGC